MTTLAERVARARVEAEVAEKAITEEERTKRALRDELDALETRKRAAEAEKRALVLADRLDVLREKLGPKVHLDAYDAETKLPGAGTFILRGQGQKATDDWKAKLQKASKNQPLCDKYTEDYTLGFVIEWNGRDLDDDLDAAGDLRKVFAELGMLATTITNIGTGLSGLDLDARKS